MSLRRSQEALFWGRWLFSAPSVGCAHVADFGLGEDLRSEAHGGLITAGLRLALLAWLFCRIEPL